MFRKLLIWIICFLMRQSLVSRYMNGIFQMYEMFDGVTSYKNIT